MQRKINSTSSDALEILRNFQECQEAQRNRDRRFVMESFIKGSIPTSKGILDLLKEMFITDVLEVLKLHPGFSLNECIESLQSMLVLFNQSAEDLMSALDSFDSYSQTHGFGLRATRPQMKTIETSVLKEVFSLSSLAHSLQDHCRHLSAKWRPVDFDDHLVDCFGNDGLHDFIVGLRNVLHHVRMIDAAWELRRSEIGSTSHFIFKVDDLNSVYDWNARAKSFLKNAGDEIDVREIIDKYLPRVRTFYDWLFTKLSETPPDHLADYCRCLKAKRDRDQLLGWKTLIGISIQQKADPYNYLREHLYAEEYQKVMDFPQSSKEQADYIISVIDEHRICDDELRNQIYKIFGVPACKAIALDS